MPSSLLTALPAPTTLPDALARIAALEIALAAAENRALGATEQRDAVVEHLKEGLLLLDDQARVTLVNDEYCRQLGLPLPAAQWLGTSALELTERTKPLFADPEGFVADSIRVWQQHATEVGTVLLLADGRVLERTALPLSQQTGAAFLVSYRDVTNRYHDQQALHQVSLVPEQSPNPILRFDAAGRRIYANAAAQRLTRQLGTAARTALGDTLRASAQVALSTGQRQQLEVPAESAWFQVEVMPVVDKHYVNLYLVDITARQAAEAQLATQRAFYEAILHSLPAEVVVVDADFRYRFLNPAAQPDAATRQAALGCTLNEFDRQLGRSAASTAQREVRFNQARAGVTVEWTEPVDRPDGTHHLLRRIEPMLAADGTPEWFIGYGLDVTDREQARQALAAEQAFMEQVLDVTPSAIYVRNVAGDFIFQNRAVAELISVTGLDTVPIPGSVLAQELALFAAMDAQVIASNAEVTAEERLTMPDGVVHWFQSVKRPLHQADGTVHILGVSNDITAQKVALQAAEAAATARENFLANMSHEIRTPMNGVLGMAAQLAKTRLDPRQQQVLNLMHRSGQHLLAVLNDVLDMAKISSGKLELEQVAFNLYDSLGAALQPLALQAAEKGLTFETVPLRTTCALPWVLSDPHRLNQIFINLVSNAVKFTETGGIMVMVELVSENTDTFTFCFRVADTGIGVVPAEQLRMFESFTQAAADTTRRYGGTGLGLSISRALVAQLGGTLSFESQVGQGSTFIFTLTLPKAPAQAPEAASPAAYDTGRLAGVRVLLIEDNDINRTVARMLLEPWGVVLDEAVDGPAGLVRLSTRRYDAVLMDVQLPGLSGVEVTQRLRRLSDPRRAATPVIALTANAFRTDVERYLAAGMNDYLTKPFDEEVLYSKIVALLDAPAVPLYDLRNLRFQAQGRNAFVVQILTSFLKNMPESLAQLRAAAAAGRWPEAAEVAHHIQPNLLALGLTGVGPALAVLGRAHRAATGPVPPAVDLTAAAEHLTATVTRALAVMAVELPVST